MNRSANCNEDECDRKIVVRCLNPETENDGLRSYFEKNFGVTSSVRISRKHVTGLSRGYGFVQFVEKASAEKAIKQKYCFIDGSEVYAVPVNGHNRESNDGPYQKPRYAKNALESSECDEEKIVTTASVRNNSQVEARLASKPSNLKAHAKRSVFSSDSDVVQDPIADRHTGKNVNSYAKPKTDVKYALDSSESDEETIVTTASVRNKTQVEARPASKASSVKNHTKRSIFSSDSDVVKAPSVDRRTGKNVNSYAKPKTDVKYAWGSSESDDDTITNGSGVEKAPVVDSRLGKITNSVNSKTSNVKSALDSSDSDDDTIVMLRKKSEEVTGPVSKPPSVKNHAKRNIFSSDSDSKKAPLVDRRTLNSSVKPKTSYVKSALDSWESDEGTIVTTASVRNKSQVEARPASKASSVKNHMKRSIFSSDSDEVKEPIVDRRTGKNVNSYAKPKTDMKYAWGSSESDDEAIVTTMSMSDKSQVTRSASKPSSVKNHGNRSIFSNGSGVEKAPVVDQRQLLASMQRLLCDTDDSDKERAAEVSFTKKEVEKDKRITSNTEEDLIDLSSGSITNHPTGTVPPSQLLVPESSRCITIVLPGSRFRRAKNNRIYVYY